MRYMLAFLPLLLLLSVCFGDSTTSTTLVNLEPPSADDINAFIQAIGGAKTFGVLGAVMAVVQLLMLAIKSKFVDLGKWNLLVVMLLSTVGGVFALHFVQNLPWMESLLHSTTIWAYQVLFNQIKKQFFTPTNPIGGA